MNHMLGTSLILVGTDYLPTTYLGTLGTLGTYLS